MIIIIIIQRYKGDDDAGVDGNDDEWPIMNRFWLNGYSFIFNKGILI